MCTKVTAYSSPVMATAGTYCMHIYRGKQTRCHNTKAFVLHKEEKKKRRKKKIFPAILATSLTMLSSRKQCLLVLSAIVMWQQPVAASWVSFLARNLTQGSMAEISDGVAARSSSECGFRCKKNSDDGGDCSAYR